MFLKNLNNKNLDEELVYSTPKEEREKKDNKKKNYNNDKKERKPRENKVEEKPAVQYDSDGFEIITEKVKATKKPKRNYDGEKRNFKKNENKEERPQTAIRKSSDASEKNINKPKPVVVEKVVMESVKII